jgi:hypothetical protein
MDVEAIEDLVGDNTGPLTESCNLDKGCLVTTSVWYAGY